MPQHFCVVSSKAYSVMDIFMIDLRDVLPAPHRLTMEWNPVHGTPSAMSQYKHCVCMRVCVCFPPSLTPTAVHPDLYILSLPRLGASLPLVSLNNALISPAIFRQYLKCKINSFTHALGEH